MANEPGALAYDWHISEDGRLCNVDELYEDAEAALAHVRGEAGVLLGLLVAAYEIGRNQESSDGSALTAPTASAPVATTAPGPKGVETHETRPADGQQAMGLRRGGWSDARWFTLWSLAGALGGFLSPRLPASGRPSTGR